MPGQCTPSNHCEQGIREESENRQENGPGPHRSSVKHELSLHRDVAEAAKSGKHLTSDHEDERHLQGDLHSSEDRR